MDFPLPSLRRSVFSFLPFSRHFDSKQFDVSSSTAYSSHNSVTLTSHPLILSLTFPRPPTSLISLPLSRLNNLNNLFRLDGDYSGRTLLRLSSHDDAAVLFLRSSRLRLVSLRERASEVGEFESLPVLCSAKRSELNLSHRRSGSRIRGCVEPTRFECRFSHKTRSTKRRPAPTALEGGRAPRVWEPTSRNDAN